MKHSLFPGYDPVYRMSASRINNWISKTTGHQAIMQNQLLPFLHTSNEQLESEKDAIYKCIKNIKYLRINWVKDIITPQLKTIKSYWEKLKP